jgi:hypothetical protein
VGYGVSGETNSSPRLEDKLCKSLLILRCTSGISQFSFLSLCLLCYLHTYTEAPLTSESKIYASPITDRTLAERQHDGHRTT